MGEEWSRCPVRACPVRYADGGDRYCAEHRAEATDDGAARLAADLMGARRQGGPAPVATLQASGTAV
jgi:hypothetical protein